MKKLCTLFLLITLFTNVFTWVIYKKENQKEELDCSDLQSMVLGNVFYFLSSSEIEKRSHTSFHLATRKNSDPVEVGLNNWNGLKTGGFNPSAKTVIIVHGFQSHSNKTWISFMKSKLLEARDVNIILVDWQKGSNHWNYINAVKTTLFVSTKISEFLEEMKTAVKGLNSGPVNVMWNHLYFIGHSLGAHISGQAAGMLKQDNFFKVERITGLDPAQPCFTTCSPNLRLDKNDADFVDIIHTQTGNSNSSDSFGLRKPIGHVDFYVNGGAMQPACTSSTIEIKKMICSHVMASNYFIESVIVSMTNECKFLGRKWNETFEDAVNVLNNTEQNMSCPNCPEMGLNASKDQGTGTFIVFTSTQAPFCKFEKKDITSVTENIEKLKPFKPSPIAIKPIHNSTIEDTLDFYNVFVNN